jgi:hypothetical protein
MNGIENLGHFGKYNRNIWNILKYGNGEGLDHSCQKLCITKRLGGHEYSTYSKKEGRPTRLVTACVGTAI